MAAPPHTPRGSTPCRYSQQFSDVQDIMQTIQYLCEQAKTSFESDDEVHRLYRYLNMLHMTVYCGLSPTYNVRNFLMPLIKKHRLLAADPAERERELKALDELDVDCEGERGFQLFTLWSLAVIQRQARKGAIPPPMFATLSGRVQALSAKADNLFHYAFQMLVRRWGSRADTPSARQLGCAARLVSARPLC